MATSASRYRMRLPPPKKATPAQLTLLPVAPLAWLGITFLVSGVLWRLHWCPEVPRRLEFRTNAAGLLIVLPALFASVAPALMVSNLVAAAIPLWRRILDREGKEFHGDDYESSQWALLKMALFVLGVTAPLMLIGVLLGRDGQGG